MFCGRFTRHLPSGRSTSASSSSTLFARIPRPWENAPHRTSTAGALLDWIQFLLHPISSWFVMWSLTFCDLDARSDMESADWRRSTQSRTWGLATMRGRMYGSCTTWPCKSTATWYRPPSHPSSNPSPNRRLSDAENDKLDLTRGRAGPGDDERGDGGL